MRLIIFAKIPNQADPIPLDILDDRPLREALPEILRLTKLAKTNDKLQHYQYLIGERKIDLNLSFSDNRIRNGDLLEIQPVNNLSQSLDDSGMIDTQGAEMVSVPQKKSKPSARSRKKEEDDDSSSSIPGVKIDFD